jgi:serine/threonine protein kinase
MKELSELLQDLPNIAPGAGKLYKGDCAIFCVGTEPKQYFVVDLEKRQMLGEKGRQNAAVYKVKYQITENASSHIPEVIQDPKFILKTWWREPFRREAKYTRLIYGVAAHALAPNLKGFENVLIREDLGDICVDEAEFTFVEYLDFAIKFLKAIQSAHERKILFRDIKERNILLTNNNERISMDLVSRL